MLLRDGLIMRLDNDVDYESSVLLTVQQPNQFHSNLNLARRSLTSGCLRWPALSKNIDDMEVEYAQ